MNGTANANSKNIITNRLKSVANLVFWDLTFDLMATKKQFAHMKLV